MSWLNKILHFLGASASAVTAIFVANEYHPPKPVAIAVGILSYVLGALAKQLVPTTTEPPK